MLFPLVEKYSKKTGKVLQCHKKDCGYKKEVNQLEETKA